jgi:hypothetical protein
MGRENRRAGERNNHEDYDEAFFPIVGSDCPCRFSFQRFKNVESGSQSGATPGSFACSGRDNTRGLGQSIGNAPAAGTHGEYTRQSSL